ncbi:MAG: DUF2939 domain-containing protein [Pseudomonadota bacterium]
MRKIIAVLILVAVAAGTWWYASPLWTLHQMREAGRSDDAEKLSEYVDYPAFREDLKGEFRRAMMSEMAKQRNDGLAMIGSAFALALIDPLIDAMVTPEGVAAMFDQAKRNRVSNKQPKLPDASNDPIIERKGFDEFDVKDKDPNKGALIFKRSGLGWKLSGIDIPPQALTATKKAE